MSFKRRPIPRRRSKKMFSRGAMRVNKRNAGTRPMRGGIRL